MIKWFTIWWWQYLLEDLQKESWSDRWVKFKCRAKGHPGGCVYYNPTGLEPDWRCKNCGDYLG